MSGGFGIGGGRCCVWFAGARSVCGAWVSVCVWWMDLPTPPIPPPPDISKMLPRNSCLRLPGAVGPNLGALLL